MKSYLIKGTFNFFVSVLFLLISSSLFALNFNEPRKVIIPQYANAVYRDLTVLDSMYFDTEKDSSRTFLLELGKRPGYFWNENKRFYLFQNLKLNLGDVVYNNSDENKNVFSISDMILGNGSFLSEKIFLNTDSSITINNSLSNLLVNYKGDFPVYFHFGNISDTYDVSSLLLKYNLGGETGTIDIAHKVDNLYLRDLKFKGSGYNGSTGVKFPSPRAMVYYDSNKYKIEGTALDFELYSPGRSKAVKNYYGPWEVYQASLTTSDKHPCGTILPSNRCQKRWCVGVPPELCIIPHSQTNPNKWDYPSPDTADAIFTCIDYDEHNPSSTFIYNPKGECYDYQEVTLMNSGSVHFNNNKAYYEFKVEEIYNIEGDTATLLSQSPKSKFDSTGNVLRPISTYTAGAWDLSTESGKFLIDGNYKTGVTVKELPSGSTENPCFKMCTGKLCTSNGVYVKSTDMRNLKGGAEADNVTNYWPSSDGSKQNLVLFTYTLIFCPKRSGTSSSYEQYEDNLNKINDKTKIRESLFIESTVNSNEWTYANVCMRRQVHCDINEEQGYDRSYRLLSTDY